jgi:hypothetical protein
MHRLNSAESGFRQHVSHALRPISSFSAAPAVTDALYPDVPSGRFGVLIAHWSLQEVAGRGGWGPVHCAVGDSMGNRLGRCRTADNEKVICAVLTTDDRS